MYKLPTSLAEKQRILLKMLRSESFLYRYMSKHNVDIEIDKGDSFKAIMSAQGKSLFLRFLWRMVLEGNTEEFRWLELFQTK